MRAVVQRVLKAAVTFQETGEIMGKIGKGFVVLLGVGNGDTEADSKYLAEKIVNLRAFEDENDKMNLSLQNVGGEILAVSQFTLYGDCRRGRRPGFSEAAPPQEADLLYRCFVEEVKKQGVKVETGVFQTDMLVDIANDGPVTLLLDSKKTF